MTVEWKRGLAALFKRLTRNPSSCRQCANHIAKSQYAEVSVRAIARKFDELARDRVAEKAYIRKSLLLLAGTLDLPGQKELQAIEENVDLSCEIYQLARLKAERMQETEPAAAGSGAVSDSVKDE